MDKRRLTDKTPAQIVTMVSFGVFLICLIFAEISIGPEAGYYCPSGDCVSRGDALGTLFGSTPEHFQVNKPGLLAAFQVVATLAVIGVIGGLLWGAVTRNRPLPRRSAQPAPYQEQTVRRPR